MADVVSLWFNSTSCESRDDERQQQRQQQQQQQRQQQQYQQPQSNEEVMRSEKDLRLRTDDDEVDLLKAALSQAHSHNDKYDCL